MRAVARKSARAHRGTEQEDSGREGGIRTRDLSVPNAAR
jgi:hypothetical protein